MLGEAWVQFLEVSGFGTQKLFDAIKAGDLARVQLFMWMGIDVAALRDDQGRQPLHCAVVHNQLEIVKYFVGLGHDKELCPSRGWTPLITACYNRHLSVAEYLLDEGCDRDSANNAGMTALHFAAAGGCLDVAQLLFRYGAKLDVRDINGRTPADIATHYGHPDIADAICIEEIRRRDHGFKRDRSTIPGTEEYVAATQPRIDGQQRQEEEGVLDESDDDDDNDNDDGEETRGDLS